MTTFTTNNFTANQIPPASVLQAVQDSIDALCPIGSYLMVHMTPPASGTLVNGAWLACDGASVSAATYVNLFNTIGTTYGGGSGSFNLPDFRGRSPFVAASGGSSDASLGKNDGAALASRRLKHSHTVNDTHPHSAAAPSFSNTDDIHSHSLGPFTPGASTLKGARSTLYYGGGFGSSSGETAAHGHSISGSLNSATPTVTAVGVSGLTDGPSYLVCCTVLIRAL